MLSSESSFSMLLIAGRQIPPNLSAVSWLRLCGSAVCRAPSAPRGGPESLGQWHLVGGLRRGLGPWCWLLAGMPQLSSGPYLPTGQPGGLIPRQGIWGLPAPHAWAPNPVECPFCHFLWSRAQGRGLDPLRGGVEASWTWMRGGGWEGHGGRDHICSVHLSLSCVRLFATPWTAARQASLSITNSWSLLKLMYIESVMPSNHLLLCRPLLLRLQSFPASGSFQMSQLFPSGAQSTGASASTSVLPMNTQD